MNDEPLDQHSTLNKTSLTRFTTVSHASFCLADPQPSMIRLMDIAVGLSNQCRYNGQIREFYSIAQHSVLVADECYHRAFLSGASESEAKTVGRMGLFHDAAEAYVGDCISPLKLMLQPAFGEIEARIQATILKACDVKWDPKWESLVDKVDKAMFVRECLDMRDQDMDWAQNALKQDLTDWMPKEKIVPCSPVEAVGRFLDANILYT